MADKQIFAIGDIHGRADLLGPLLDHIEGIAAHGNQDYRIIFLGDIMDRGESSRQAMDLVVDTMTRKPDTVFIRGNHDWFPIRILDELEGYQQQAGLHHWIVNMGGDATLRSYGYDPSSVRPLDLHSVFPQEHLDALRGAVSHLESGDHLFVHAGVVPGVPMADQRPYDLMWVREPFLLAADHGLGKIVIHGHSVTPTSLPEVYAHRIALDTGAYKTGLLTAVQIGSVGEPTFIGSTASGIRIVAPHVGQIPTIEMPDFGFFNQRRLG